jgi:hypothetical protein
MVESNRPEEAARALDEKLRPFPWYISIGIGNTERGVALFVYVKTAHRKELQFLSHGWMGYPVLIRPVGSIRPTAKHDPDYHDDPQPLPSVPLSFAATARRCG